MKRTFPIVLPEMTIDGIKDAEKKSEELYALAQQLRAAVWHAKSMEADPVVRMLNRHLGRGAVFYCEFGRYNSIVDKPYKFRQKKDGGITASISSDARIDSHSSYDRIYKLNLYGPSELLYDRTAVDCRPRCKRPQTATRRKDKKDNCSKAVLNLDERRVP